MILIVSFFCSNLLSIYCSNLLLLLNFTETVGVCLIRINRKSRISPSRVQIFERQALKSNSLQCSIEAKSWKLEWFVDVHFPKNFFRKIMNKKNFAIAKKAVLRLVDLKPLRHRVVSINTRVQAIFDNTVCQVLN